VIGARAVVALALAVVAGPAPAAAGPLPVVTTTSDLAALVRTVGGDRVAVSSLAPPLQDPHGVEIKPAHIARLRQAALLVRVGLDHEPWLARALATAGAPAPAGPRDLDASRTIPLLQTETPRLLSDRAAPHLHGLGNPHYWLDPENARPITAAVADALSRLVPADRTHFERRRRSFLDRLDAGLARWRAALQPYRGTRVVAVHDTWPYFAARFGLVVVATVEPAPGVPPSPAAIGALVERMRAAGIGIVLAEPYADPSLVRRLTEATGARAVTLVPSVGGDSAAADYLALFDLAVERLASALGPR